MWQSGSFVLVLSFALLVNVFAGSGNSDCEILQRFYNATNGSQWKNNTGWEQTLPSVSSDCCTWYGIECEQFKGIERVTVLSVDNNGLTGDLIPELVNLTMLRIFHAAENSLNGTLPTEWGAGWEYLISLSLRNNELRGTLPSDWHGWANVQNVSLGHNRLSGSLPTEWAWPEIYRIQLHHNQLTGALPDWPQMPSLQRLWLERNLISSTLPSWEHFTQMTAIGVNNNLIYGTLPKWTTWKNFQQLWMHHNNISGSLPSEWSEMSELVLLSLTNNSLSGPLPDYMSTSSSLSVFFASNNSLSGPLNACNPRLRVLQVSRNEFSSISSCLQYTQVGSLDVRWNPITEFPWTLGASPKLILLDLRETQLYLRLDELPHGINVVPDLRIGQNSGVVGTLSNLIDAPRYGMSVSSYTTLDVSSTEINGTFDYFDPEWFDTFPLHYVQFLNASFLPDVNGTLPYKWFEWVKEQTSSLTIDVSGTENLHMGSLDELNFDEHAPGQMYGSVTFICQPIVWPDGVLVLGLSPEYFDFHTCRCAPGYHGNPPFCSLVSHTPEVVSLSVVFGVTAIIALILGTKQFVRWRAMMHDLKRAKELLGDYATHTSAVSVQREGKETDDDVSQTPLQISREWIVPFEDIQVVKLVAQGSQGRVSMAIWNRTIVALKEFLLLSASDQQTLMHEAAIHVQLHHKNILQLCGVTIEPPCTITEWMARGSLYDVIHTKLELLPPILSVASDIARGMLHLHRKGIIHRDLKSLNVMLDQHGTAKVGDFGTARGVLRPDMSMTMARGTAHWMAPEVFQGKQYTGKCDVYSYGIILWELCTKQHPYDDLRFTHQIEQHVCDGNRPPLPCGPDAPQVLVQIMRRCWDVNPENRPTFDDIVKELDEARNSAARKDSRNGRHKSASLTRFLPFLRSSK